MKQLTGNKAVRLAMPKKTELINELLHLVLEEERLAFVDVLRNFEFVDYSDFVEVVKKQKYVMAFFCSYGVGPTESMLKYQWNEILKNKEDKQLICDL